jgi:hypothetical protein
MSEVVERAALALCASQVSRPSCVPQAVCGRPCEECLADARAVIAAMREPDNRMINAAAGALTPSYRNPRFLSVKQKLAIRYRKMIDAALAEPAAPQPEEPNP